MITVSAEVCASGSNASGITTAELYRSPGRRVEYSDDPIATAQVPNIDPNTCATVEFMVRGAVRRL